MSAENLDLLAQSAEEALAPLFREIDRTAEKNTARVMEAFCRHKV